jgi:hypothetical protein
MDMYVAIGSDGTRDVVWGMGESEEQALEQARDNLNSVECEGAEGCELRMQEIGGADVAAIEAGDVDAASLGRA